ncbi:hypothetical protein BJY52DRAFT_1191049 [Lactarius psammicola]|nr:hypothetical protein BJY52DRAFT_1191049 [Lactarius psammicola]
MVRALSKSLFLLSEDYALAKANGRDTASDPVTWLLNGVLLANEWYEGYPFARSTYFHRTSGVGYNHVGTSAKLQHHHVVSFSKNYHYACNRIGIADVRHSPTRLPAREFMGLMQSIAAWGRIKRQEARGYVPPARHGAHSHLRSLVLLRALRSSSHAQEISRAAGDGSIRSRFFISLFTMETLLHIVHVVAINDAHAWSGMSLA